MSKFVNLKNKPLVRDPNGKEMSGGEGVVWPIKDWKKLYPFAGVAKVYHQGPTDEQKAKLKTMIRLPAAQRNELLQFAAWPIDAIFDAGSKSMLGYVMPFAGDHKGVHSLYNTKDRRKHFPQADWSFLVCTAMNVARAFAASRKHRSVSHTPSQSRSGATVFAFETTSAEKS